jgi:cyanophycin synthetase
MHHRRPQRQNDAERMRPTLIVLLRSIHRIEERLRGIGCRIWNPCVMQNQSDATSPLALKPMRVLERSVYIGPNLHSDMPMIRICLDLGSLEEWPSNRIPDFTDRLLAMLPGLDEHGCSYQEHGGLVRRLREGTWLGHVTEHVALEFQRRCGIAVTRGKTRSVRGKPGVYNVLYSYLDGAVGRMAGWLALQLVDSLLRADLQGVAGLDNIWDDHKPIGRTADGGFDLDAAMALLSRKARRAALGPTTRSLVQEAQRRDIPMMRLDEHSLVQLGQGIHQRRIRASITSLTSYLAVEAAGDKKATKALLADVGVPVPRGVVVHSAEEAADEAERLGYPLVTKPLDGNHGRGVSLNLTTGEEVRQGYAYAARHGEAVVLEQQFTGGDHRLLVIGGELVAVAQRVPAHVIGDGRSTISQLVEEVNRDPRRGNGHENTLTRIVLDEQAGKLLARTGLDFDSVPEAGCIVFLCETANLSTGGIAIDRTDEIHPENATMARRAAMAVGLDVAGIDFITSDITRSVRETGGGIVEVNASPGFRMHLEPFEGRARDIARPVINLLFPPGQTGRVPILAITGTNGKSTTTRMVAHIVGHSGKCVGYTSTNGVFVDDQLVAEGDSSGPKSARMVLRDPRVEVAVLETARGGILREGLGFDRCDVGAVLNVQEDHLGLRGIDTVEDLADVKSVVVEAVHRNGCSVLNADDPLVVAMERHAGGRTAFFSMRAGAKMPGFLRQHIADGHLAVLHEAGRDGGDIVVYDDTRRLPLMRVTDLPATLGGAARFNVQNALAAVAITYAYGLSLPKIRNALTAFTSSYEQNPGRLNVHDGHGFRVIMDYAHNPAGLTALGEVVEGLRPGYRRIIGMVSIPGDRRDEDIRAMGRISAPVFDEIVVRERPDGRGRPDGEVTELIAQGALAMGFPEDHLHRVFDEPDAIEFCLRMAKPGDLVVLMPTEINRAWAQIVAFRSQVAQSSDDIGHLKVTG